MPSRTSARKLPSAWPSPHRTQHQPAAGHRTTQFSEGNEVLTTNPSRLVRKQHFSVTFETARNTVHLNFGLFHSLKHTQTRNIVLTAPSYISRLTCLDVRDDESRDICKHTFRRAGMRWGSSSRLAKSLGTGRSIPTVRHVLSQISCVRKLLPRVNRIPVPVLQNDQNTV